MPKLGDRYMVDVKEIKILEAGVRAQQVLICFLRMSDL